MRKTAHTEQAVFGLQHDVNACRDVVGHQRRDADPEIDVVAIAQLPGDAGSHLFASQHNQRLPARSVRCSMRFSNWPTISRST